MNWGASESKKAVTALIVPPVALLELKNLLISHERVKMDGTVTMANGL